MTETFYPASDIFVIAADGRAKRTCRRLPTTTCLLVLGARWTAISYTVFGTTDEAGFHVAVQSMGGSQAVGEPLGGPAADSSLCGRRTHSRSRRVVRAKASARSASLIADLPSHLSPSFRVNTASEWCRGSASTHEPRWNGGLARPGGNHRCVQFRARPERDAGVSSRQQERLRQRLQARRPLRQPASPRRFGRLATHPTGENAAWAIQSRGGKPLIEVVDVYGGSLVAPALTLAGAYQNNPDWSRPMVSG